MSFSCYGSITYQTLKCWVCGCQFAIDTDVYHNRASRGEPIWCPIGCKLGTGEARSVKLERELATARTRIIQLKESRERAQRSAIALRGVVTRTKRRIASGKCACCEKTFANLGEHMRERHPDYGEE